MIQRVVAFALRFQAIILATTLLVAAGGALAYSELDIEAYPNPCPPLVETLVQPMGWSAEEVERYVTIPMEVGLSGMRGLVYIRSQSLFSLSDIKCYFAWGTDYWADRQEVINRMTTVATGPQGSRFHRDHRCPGLRGACWGVVRERRRRQGGLG